MYLHSVELLPLLCWSSAWLLPAHQRLCGECPCSGDLISSFASAGHLPGRPPAWKYFQQLGEGFSKYVLGHVILKTLPAVFSEQQTCGKLEPLFRQKPVPPAVPSHEPGQLSSRKGNCFYQQFLTD